MARQSKFKLLYINNEYVLCTVDITVTSENEATQILHKGLRYENGKSYDQIGAANYIVTMSNVTSDNFENITRMTNYMLNNTEVDIIIDDGQLENDRRIKFKGFVGSIEDAGDSGIQRYNVSLRSSGIIEQTTIGGVPTTTVRTFTDLLDTPASYVGSGGKIPRVNLTEDAIEFINNTTNLISLTDGPNEYDNGKVLTSSGGGWTWEEQIDEFVELNDVPDYGNNGLKYLRLNADATGLTWADATGPDGGGINLQTVLDTGNEATQDINLTGILYCTNTVKVSDSRLKENIVDYTPEDIKFDVKEYNLIGSDVKEIGVIAQDTEQDFVYQKDNGYYGVDYIQLLLAKVKELEIKIKKLEDGNK